MPASRDVLFSDENLFLSLRAPPTECQTNPCGAGSWPWLDQEDGYYRWAWHKLILFSTISISSNIVDDQPKLRGSGVVVTLVCEYTWDPEGI